MNAAWLVRLYPREWRARYGDELADILSERASSPGLILDVLVGAFDAHLHPHLEPVPATQRGAFLLPRILRCRPTRGMLVGLLVYAGLVAGLGTLRRIYGFNFGLDFFYFAVNGALPLLWLSGSEPAPGLRSQTVRLMVVLPGAVLAGLVGTLLTNGPP